MTMPTSEILDEKEFYKSLFSCYVIRMEVVKFFVQIFWRHKEINDI